MIKFLGFIAVFVSSLRSAAQHSQEAEQVTLLRLLATCLENGVSPAPVVSAFGAICSDESSNEVTALATVLGDGARLGDALRGQRFLLPTEAVVAAEFNIPPQNTAAGLRAAADALESRGRAGRQSMSWGSGSWAHLFSVAIAVGAVLTFLSAAGIIQKMTSIMQIHGVKVPVFSALLFEYFNTIITSFLMFVVLLFTAWMLWFISKLAGLQLGRGMFEPALAWLFPRSITPGLLRMLQLGFVANVPIPEMLQSIARTNALPYSSERFGGVETLVEEGVSFLVALSKQGFINRTELQLLEASQRVSNLPWVLGELARDIERRAASRRAAFLTSMNVVGLLILSTAVAAIVVGMFLPVIAMIESSM